MKQTALVTGGCGFIGSHVVHLLRQECPEWRVVNLDKLTYAGRTQHFADVKEGPHYRFVQGDIADRMVVSRLFQEERPAFVVHLAAESHVDRSILDSSAFVQTNVLGTHVLLEAARAFGVSRFLHVSTDEVYGDVGADGPPATEDSPFRQSSPYAASKAGADLLCQAYRRTYRLPILIARPCNQYGPRQFPEKLIPFMIRRLLRGETLPLYGDGRQRRDWLYVEDGARALLTILQRGAEGRIYNIAAHDEHENRDVVRMLCELMAQQQSCSVASLWARVACVADRPGHDFRYAMDDSRLRTETQWRPTVDLKERLQQTIAWYLSHQEWLDQVESVDYPHYYDRRTFLKSGTPAPQP